MMLAQPMSLTRDVDVLIMMHWIILSLFSLPLFSFTERMHNLKNKEQIDLAAIIFTHARNNSILHSPLQSEHSQEGLLDYFRWMC